MAPHGFMLPSLRHAGFRLAGLLALALIIAGLAYVSLRAERIQIPIDGGHLLIAAPSFKVQRIVHRKGQDYAVVETTFEITNESHKEWVSVRLGVDIADPAGQWYRAADQRHSFVVDVARMARGRTHKIKTDREMPVRNGTNKKDVVIGATTFTVESAASQDETSVFSTLGRQRYNPSFSLLPFEHIDVTSGNLLLSFVDLDLPGNGLLSLTVPRSYNLRDGMSRLGPGYIKYADALGDCTVEMDEEDRYPIIVSADGAEHLTAGIVGDPSAMCRTAVFITRELWRYDRRTHVLEMPNGVTMTYDRVFGTTRYPTEARDPFGNTLAYAYENDIYGQPRLTAITQDLGGGQVRLVSFAYDTESGDLRSMTYGDKTWTYDGTSVTDPEGRTWTVGQSVGEDPLTSLITVTMPTGGWVTYVCRPVTDNWQLPEHKWIVVTERRTGGGDEAGTWIFDYRLPWTGQEWNRIVTGPDGRAIEYAVGPDPEPWQVKRRVKAPGSPGEVVETEQVDWIGTRLGWMAFNGKSIEDARTVASRVVSRDGHTPYRTDYVYHAENVEQDGCQVPGHGADWRRCTYRDYLEPYEIRQHGDFDRTIEREFRHDFGTRYIRAKVTKETVDDTYRKEAAYDDLGFLTSATVLGVTTTYDRSSNGNLSKKTDATDRWTEYAHSWGRVSRLRTPVYSVQRGINPDGTVAWEGRDGPDVTDPARKTSFTYDLLGRETSRTPPLGLATATSYAHERDATDPYVEVTRGSASTRSFFDGYGRTVRTENAAGIKTQVSFDLSGRKAFESYPYSGSTPIGSTYTYDALDRVTSKTEADNKQTTFGYGSRSDGLTVGITEPFGQGGSRTTVQTWEATGDPNARRLIRVVDAAQQVTEYGYNALDKLTAVVSPVIPARQYHYVAGTDRLEWETHPESGTTSYGYFANGTLQTRSDALGHTLTYSYDAVNRLQGVSASADANYSVGITYDDPYSDNRATAGNAFVSSGFGYDAAGRLQSRTDTLRATPGAAGRTFTTTYTPTDYDSVGGVTYPTGRTVTYGYDSLQRITSVADGTRTYASGFSYHPSGQVGDYTSGNGVTNQFRYDPLTYRPATITHAGGGQSLLALTYSYDDEGNVRGITDARPNMSADFTGGYDPLDRLVKAIGPWGTVEFTYDAVGNRRSKVQNGTTTTYTYPANGRNLLGATSGGGQPDEPFGYNAVGETGSDARGTYAYTPTGLMAMATLTSGLTVTHRYDADDLRAVKVKEGKVQYFLHGLGGQLLSEYVEEGGELAWTQDYVYAGSRLLATVRAGVNELRVSRVGNGTVTSVGGAIDCGTTCTATLPPGTVVTLHAAPAAGWSFVHWEGGCTGTATSTTVTVTGSVSCTARFTRPVTISITKAGSGSGTVTATTGTLSCGATCSAVYDAYVPVELVATPAAGSRVAGWSGDADCADGRLGPDADTHCVATFIQTYPLSVTKTGVGSDAATVTSAPIGLFCGGTCGAPFDAGTTVTLTAQPFAGFTFVGWSGEGCATGVVLMDRARSCTATFRFPATKLAPANGATGQASTVNLTWSATANAGYWVCLDATDNHTCDGMWWPNGASTWREWGGLALGTYYWQVRVQTEAGTFDSNDGVWWSVTVGPPPAVFGKTAPSNGATNLASPVTLTWGAVAGATCDVCWDTTNNATCDGTWQSAGTATSLPVSGLAPGTYSWQVRANGTEADTGTWWSFTVAPPSIPADHWKAEYFSNTGLTGTPASTVDEGTGVVDHSWGSGGPSGLPSDNFSARFTRTVMFAAGRYRFTIVTDDGSRLWVDNQLKIDAWWDQAPTTYTVDVDLTAGAHTLKYEYYEHTGGATAQLSWVTGLAGPLAVHLQVDSGQYVVAENGGGGAVNADRWAAGSWETFTLEDLNGGLLADGDPVAFRTDGGYYLQAVWGGGWGMTAAPQAVGAWETFTLVNLDQPGGLLQAGAHVALRSDNGSYACAEDGGGSVVNVNRSAVGAWEMFVLEVASSPAPAAEPDETPSHAATEPWVDEGDEAGSAAAVFTARPPAHRSNSAAAFLPAGRSVVPVVPSKPMAAPLPAAVTGSVPRSPSGSRPPSAGALSSPPPPANEIVEYYHVDALGSVRVVTDAAGQVLRHHDFLPFGEEWQPQTPPADQRLFTGKERDVESGLDYFGARYYRADLGRFTSVDPVDAKDELDTPRRWNRYTYSFNNPLSFVDPDGRTVKVSADEAHRAWLMRQLVDWIGSEAAQYVHCAWNEDLGSWELVVTDISMSQLMSKNPAAWDLGQMIGDPRSVTIKVTEGERLPDDDAAYTYDVGTRGGNTEPIIVLRADRTAQLYAQGQSFFTGRNKWELEKPVGTMRWGIALAHESGHAWGNINGRRTSLGQTWQEALNWEYTARLERYGSNTARRIIH